MLYFWRIGNFLANSKACFARQRLGMDGELAALAALERGSEADLDAELVRLVRLALADAKLFLQEPPVDRPRDWPARGPCR